MKWCIETIMGEVFEVTTLFNQRGDETESLDEACACVIKFGEHAYQDSLIEDRLVHRLQ